MSWPHHLVGDPANPPVMFLHGFMGAGADWLPIAELCAGHFFCILSDLPGHGRHTNLLRSQPLSFDSVVEGLIELLEQLKLKRVSLVGYSMGGRLALYAATQFPQKINALVLESANPGLADPVERKARAATDDKRAETLLAEGLDAFVEQWYEMELFSTLKRHPHLLRQTKLKRKRNDARWVAKAISELSSGRQPSLWDKLPALPMPVLLVAGALDSKYASLVQAMQPKIPKATVEIVSNAGHNVHLENPQQFATLIIRFLR